MTAHNYVFISQLRVSLNIGNLPIIRKHSLNEGTQPAVAQA